MAVDEIIPCAVIIDEQVPRGSVELSRTIFKRARLEEGQPVVVSGKASPTKVRGVLGEHLQRCEIAMDPHLAVYLGIKEGDEVDVSRPIRVGGQDPSKVEDFVEVLKQPQDRLAPLMGEDLRHFSGMTVEQVLDHLVRHGSDYSRSYLVVAPNPDGVGIPTGEACEDPSLNVKVWDPSE